MPDHSTEDRPKGRTVRPLVALWPFLKPYRSTLILACIVLIVAAAALLAIPAAARLVIDEGFSANNVNAVNQYFLGFLSVAIVFGFFAALRFYLVIWLGERVVADIRRAIYARVIDMDTSFFEVTRTGEVLSRLTTDTTLVQSIAGAGLSIALRSSLTLIGGLFLLFYTNFKLTMYMLMFMPVILVPLILVGRRIRKLSMKSQEKIADSSGLADETLNAVQTIQAFTLEERQKGRFNEKIEDSFIAAVKRIRVRALMTAMGVTLVFGAITFVMWLGSRTVMSGHMSAGELGEFVMYGFFVGMSVATLSELWGEVMRAAGAMERIGELLAVQSAIRTPTKPLSLPASIRGGIRFEAVTFAYPSRPSIAAIDDLNLTINPGDTVAIVGPSGAGKSTLFQLLLRFYDVDAGAILIDGIDIAKLDPQRLRANLGLVPQETNLFGETAMENIRLGRPDASDTEVMEAARAAAAEEFILRLPEKYDTFLGERGSRLSGGQRQRIAIARAILKNPPILLLDEATSSLDASSEQLVQTAMHSLQQGRTTLVIAHRLATVKNADKILVMDRAKIVASGTHHELLQSNPLYAELAKLQFREAKSIGTQLSG